MDIFFKLKYESGGKQFTTDSVHTEHFALSVNHSDNKLHVSINPKAEIRITEFVNGYQSWTDSLEYTPDGQMLEQSRLTEFLVTKSPLKYIGFSKSGDNLFHKFPRQNGIFYGWSYAYVRNGNHVDLFGSLSEKSGYTIITCDTCPLHL